MSADGAEQEFTKVYVIHGRDFVNAGRASTDIKDTLKDMGLGAAIIRRLSIAAYEAEMNVVMYASRGTMTLQITPASVEIRVDDEGPGIEDLALAMQEGYSTATPEMREMGFGAGMGLPNIRKNSDRFELASEVGRGTQLHVGVDVN